MNANAPAQRRLLWLIVAGFALRAALLAGTLGTDDAYIWQSHGELLQQYGFRGAYEVTAAAKNPLNHPPIPLLYAGACAAVHQATGLHFPLLFRLPIVLLELLAVRVLISAWRQRDGRGWVSAALWAWSPAALLLGAYHGNTDLAVGIFVLLSAHLIVRGKPAWAGLALAAAVNTKIVPLLILPALAAALADRRAITRAIVGFALGMLPFVAAAMVGGRAFIDGVFGYRAYGGEWGVALLLGSGSHFPRWGQAMHAALRWYIDAGGRWVMIGLLLTLAGVAWANRRRWNAYELSALGLSLFLLAAPAFAMQYLAFPLAAMCAVDRWRGATYGLVAGAFAAVVYAAWWTGTFPVQSLFKDGSPSPGPLIGLLAWGSLGGFIAHTLLRPASLAATRPAEASSAQR
jgi:hypothetical protein